MNFGIEVETLKEKQDLLTLINDAIKNLLMGGVQSYKIGKRDVTRINLTELYRFRKILQDEVADMQTNSALGNVTVSYFDRR
jgi:hypothetical protein